MARKIEGVKNFIRLAVRVDTGVITEGVSVRLVDISGKVIVYGKVKSMRSEQSISNATNIHPGSCVSLMIAADEEQLNFKENWNNWVRHDENWSIDNDFDHSETKDSDHLRWYKIEMMLDVVNVATHPWIEEVSKRIWEDVCSKMETDLGLETDYLEDVGIQRQWMAELQNHCDKNYTLRESNTDIKEFADIDVGYIRMITTFCTSLGTDFRKPSISALDSDASLNIIKHAVDFKSLPDDCITGRASEALQVRHSCKHAPTPKFGKDKVSSK